jgi:carbon-monoxide dehydrogenase medium subunit
MRDFQFHRPSTVAEAKKLLGQCEAAKLLSGGQSLLPVLKLDMAQPSDLISLSGIASLRGIRFDGNRVEIGAGVTHAEVAASKDLQKRVPSLTKLADGIADPQVRNRGTLGGSLAHADPAADYPAAVLALSATIKTDRRTISADDFFVGIFETALASDEIIESCCFQIPRRAAYAKFASHASRYAVVGVMVAQFADGVRVGVTGAGPSVFRWKEAEAALSNRFAPDAINALCYHPDDLTSSLEASAEYRAHLVKAMTQRAVTNALQQGGLS